jgi:hypothetical protein
MHAFIHRALAPQTISCAWLVLTVALTFALAVAHSAIAAGSSLSAAGVPTAHIALAVPARAPAPEAAPCRAATPVEAARAGAHRSAAATHAACRPRGASSWLSEVPILAPVRHRTGADALAALYGGAGPHGPPAADGIDPAAGLFAISLTLDSSLSLDHSAASRPAAPAVAASSPLMPLAGAPA